MTYEASKHHGFDRSFHPPLNSRYPCKAASIIYPVNEFETESDSSIVLISLHNSNNPGAPSTATAPIASARPSQVGITSLGPLSYDRLFIPHPLIPSQPLKLKHQATRLHLYWQFSLKICSRITL